MTLGVFVRVCFEVKCKERTVLVKVLDGVCHGTNATKAPKYPWGEKYVQNKRKEVEVDYRPTPAGLGSRLEPCELRLS